MESPIAEVTEEQQQRDLGKLHDLLARTGPRRVLVGIALVVAVAMRVYVAAGRMGALHADEAVTGLMARHFLGGELSVFYWGQSYGGSAEALLTAAAFAPFGSSTAALRAVPLVLTLVTALLIWRIGRRVFGEPGASFAAVLFLLWPAWLVWKSLQAHGYYAMLIVTAAASVLAAIHLHDDPRPWRYGILGSLLGLGWWTSPQIVIVGLPIVVFLLVARNTRNARGFAVMAGAGFVASLPWWIWNMRHGWHSVVGDLDLPPRTYGERFEGLVQQVLPQGLGLRVPAGEWVLPSFLGWALYGVIIAGFVWFVVRAIRSQNKHLLLFTGIALTFPGIYVISEHTWYVAEPRYLAVLFPVMCLIIGWGFNRSYAVALLGLALTLPLTIAGLRGMDAQFAGAPVAGEHPRPSRLTEVIEVLREHDVEYVIADYWVAYPLTFETREDIIATSTGQIRYEPHDAIVKASPSPAYVFVTGDYTHEVFEEEREAEHPDYVPVLETEYTIYVKG